MKCERPAPPQKCVSLNNICFEGEQIIVQDGQSEERLNRLLNRTRDPSDAFTRLHPMRRPTVLISQPSSYTYKYLPLAVGAKKSALKRARFLSSHHVTGSTPEEFSSTPAHAFFTTWSNSFTEIFARSVVQVSEIWCRDFPDRGVYIIPAMFGSKWGPDYSAFWLTPFTKNPVEPMALTPEKVDVESIWYATANEAAVARYRLASESMFASRTRPRCFLQAQVCDYTSVPPPQHTRPWATMQEIVAFHSGGAYPAPRSLGRRMRVVFAKRTGRRKLIGVETLVEECNGWRHPRFEMSCIAHNFGEGLVKSLPVLMEADVFISPHGADIINAFALRRGAIVFEVMPVYQNGCPCVMYKKLFSSEAGERPAVHYYQVSTTNKSMVESDVRHAGTYNMNIRVPWGVFKSALLDVIYVGVGGESQKYRYKKFIY